MEKNMQENFMKLEGRVFDSLYNSDLEKINYELSKLREPTIVTGVGGSSVVSLYASKNINKKNGIITQSMEPRDIKYMNLKGFKNVLACSYSGNNYGVEISFLNNLKHYLLSSKENENEDITNITYYVEESEHSFISLAATLIPCAILLNYELGNEKERIIDDLESYDFNFDVNCDAYEIFTGFETSTASKFLESTMVESGIGIPIIHDKYSYCHGRSTLCKTSNNVAIYFNLETELDKLLLEELPKYYKEVVVINTINNSLNEFILLNKCMYLTKYIAEIKEKDLSDVDYNPMVKKLYKYNGNL